METKVEIKADYETFRKPCIRKKERAEGGCRKCDGKNIFCLSYSDFAGYLYDDSEKAHCAELLKHYNETNNKTVHEGVSCP